LDIPRFFRFRRIDKTARAGGRTIELYPGQKLGPDKPGAAFDHNSADDLISAVTARLQERGIRAVNYGVVSVPNDEAGARKLFTFAKNLAFMPSPLNQWVPWTLLKNWPWSTASAPVFTTSRRPADASYQLWDPHYVLSLIKDRYPLSAPRRMSVIGPVPVSTRWPA